MNAWTHVICLPCWNARHERRTPMQITDAPEEQCCYCQRMTMDGIYVRENPAKVACQGKTGNHTEDI